MKKSKKIILISILSFVFMIFITIGVFAYYEYYGQYASILNIDGTIKLDAFDVLYPELREDLDSNSDKTYGCTPENPYVIDNVLRLKNLIRLNNSGKLQRSKEKDGVDKYYFCLQFDAEDIPQVLNLLNEGEFQSIGNNQYPFVDELSGVVYAYEIKTNNYVYYSGCLPEIKTYTLTSPVSQASGTYNSTSTYYKLVTGSNYQKVNISSAEEFNTNKASLYTAATATESETYYLANRTYDSSSFVSSSASAAINSVVLTNTMQYIPASSLIKVHQVIANETIVADLEQVDVGFVSSIGNKGYVHDIILYNETIKCEEENHKDLFTALADIISSLTNHNNNYEDNHDERHIGLFAGHIANGGNAYNISVGGSADLQINTQSVNYFSNYTTVGYIEDSALIGGKSFSEIATDSLLDGDVAGVLFADSIYSLTAGTKDSGSQYALTNIDANSSVGWPGTDGTTFKYGSFTFLLSASNDVVSSIWNGTKTFLGQNGKNVYSYALYCSDEYRYSPDTQSGSAFNQASASLKETIYDGITSLDNSGNVIDAGKYIIVAHVGNNYYALKMAAQTDGTNVTYYFDTSSNINVTFFLNNDPNDDKQLYQSCLWEVTTPSSTPTFENSRFEGKYLTINDSDVAFATVEASASEFGVDIQNSLFYFDDTTGSTNERYYLNFDSSSNEFYFDTTPNTAIELFQISNGFEINEVTSYANIVEDGQYFIAAYYNNNYYLIGTATSGQTVLQQFTQDVLLSTVSAYTNNFSTTMTIEQYTTYANYIWRANKNNNRVSFIDKLSSSYYLSNDGSDVTLSTNQIYWAYNGYNNGTSLDYNGNYLTAVYSASPANNTCFDVTTTSEYRIFLLSITPEDSTPPYISYDGARYIDAEASTISCGDYVLVADYNNNTYAIGLSSSTAATATSVDTSNYSLGNAYIWSIADGTESTTYSLRMENKYYTSYYLYGSTTTISGSTISRIWYYDAINKYVYFVQGDNIYYLNYNGSLSVSTSASTNISLYQYETQWTYSVTRVNPTDSNNATSPFQNSNVHYMISTQDLSDENKECNLVGAYTGSDNVYTEKGYSVEDFDYKLMNGRYNVISGNGTSFVFTTTTDLKYFLWISAVSSGTYGYWYNYGFSLETGNYNKYLAANSAANGGRLPKIYYATEHSTGTGIINRFVFNINLDSIGFVGQGKTYYYGKTDDNLVTIPGYVNNANTPQTSTAIVGNSVIALYYYSCTFTDDKILTLVSSEGDELDEEIHYALVAKSGTSYYAMTYDSNNASNGITGTDMTQQVNQIKNAGSAGYDDLTTIPSNCDFEQMSSNYELRFKHYNSSTKSSYNYLDFTNSASNCITNTDGSYTSITAMHYDIINKKLSYKISATTYYITYDSVNNVFGTSTTEGAAAEIILIRYTPSYKVTLVSDLEKEDLSSGQYIIAGHSANGYLALGASTTTIDITQYLTETLSEDNYLSILSFIWNQIYYEIYTTENYNTDISAGTLNFMMSNAATGTGIIAYYQNSTEYFQGSSSATKWEFTVSNGIWTLLCNAGIASATNRYMYFTASGTTSSLTMTDTYGAIGSYVSGTGSVTANEEDGVQVVLYEYDSSNQTNPYTVAEGITAGNQYVMFIRTSNYYYLVNYNNNTYTTTQVGKNLNGVATKITNANVNNYLLTATSGTYGYSLQFGSTGYYLYASGNTLSADTTETTWDYYYNGTYLNKCRLYTISSANISGRHLDVSGSKVTTIATTDTSVGTYLYTVNGTSGSYTLGSLATGTLSPSNKYAIVIFKNGLYYTVANDGLNDVTNIGYNAAIPTTLTDAEVFSVSSGYHFYQTIDDTPYYLVIGGDSSLTLNTSYGQSSFSYTGQTGSAASYTYNANNSGAGMYLFKVEKNDELDATSDVTVTLTGHAEVKASLSVNQTGKYIIVASYDNEDYVLGMINYDESIALDISEEFDDALDGDAISLFKAAIFEQLGTDYSLVFNSLAFSGSSYYLLDGRYESQIESKPTITEYTLFDSNIDYYTVKQSVATEYVADTNYYTYSNNVFTLDSTVDANTNLDGSTKYYVLEIEEFIGEDFVSGVTYYTYNSSLHTYTKVNYETDTTVLNIVKDDSNYIWSIYTYAVTGGTSYVLGYYDEALDRTYYLYFDQTNKAFKLTSDVDTAKNYQVQIYMLGEEAESQSSYQTFNIELEDDGVTIASFPLTEIEADEFKQYSSTASTSIEAESGKTVSGIIPGEYLIAAKEGNSYYALSLSSSSSCTMAYADVSLYFGGTFERDTNGYYCISVNTKYLWKQQAAEGSFTYDSSTGIVSGLNFLNYAYNVNLCYSGNTTTNIYYDGTYVYLVNNATTYYLHFENGSGFTWSSSGGTQIVFYSVGAIAQSASGETATNYTYYTESIDKLDYTNFAFSEKQISELQNYANAFGTYEYTTGWLVNSNTTLTEVHDSVYFKSGIPYSNDMATFAAQFSSIEYTYDVENGLATTTNTLTYYAPKGTASFAVAEASDADPVYLNVMVSTQLDTSVLQANILRYLSLYKVATIDYETNTLTTYSEYNSSTSSQEAFAKTLLDYRYTPYAAIPLPNSQDSTDTTASADYVKVGETGYQLDDVGYDHLIAHTFIITEPGVYYLGSTAGSVAFSYLSIDKMRASEESEDSSVTISEDFTIDYVWGEVASSNNSSFAQVSLNVNDSQTLDNNINTVAYVGRVDSSDSLTWTHSNIYPEFVVGTAGIKEPDGGTDYYTISLTDVDSQRITSFDSSETYYTYDNGVYTEVNQLTTAFDSTVEYYINDGEQYVLVNAIPTNGVTYYYVTLTPEGDITLTPQVGGTDITYFMSTRKYFTLSATLVSITEFDPEVAYYTLSDGIYTLDYNPTDYLRLTLSRAYVTNQTSRLTVNYYTVDDIYNYGYGVMYINANKNSLKTYRLLTFTYHKLNSETDNFTN